MTIISEDKEREFNFPKDKDMSWVYVGYQFKQHTKDKGIILWEVTKVINPRSFKAKPLLS